MHNAGSVATAEWLQQGEIIIDRVHIPHAIVHEVIVDSCPDF